MKKSKVALLSLVLIVLTVAVTYVVTTTFLVGEKYASAETTLPGEGTSIASSNGAGADSVALRAAKKANILSDEEYEKYLYFLKKYEDLEELQDYILETYYKEVTPELLMEGAKKGVFDSLGDPYSVYMDQEEFQSFKESIEGEFPGIGVYVSPNPEKGIEIVSPIEDTPAFAAGLKAQDIIKAVNGVEYTEKQMDEAVKNIRGPVGTDVTLTIYRPSANKTFDVTIRRAIIVVKVVKSEMLGDGIGYLRLTQFDSHASSEFETHLKALIEKGAKGLVFDLRDNPGGSLDECVRIANMLLPKAVICSTKGRADGTSEVFYSKSRHYDPHLVVLINGGSASASEIVAGAIKDNKRGVLVGTKTFGKGIVQTFMPYKKGTGLKLTTSEYFTPSGVNIHGIGIVPDHVVELSERYKSLKNPTHADDNQLQKAIDILKSMMGR